MNFSLVAPLITLAAAGVLVLVLDLILKYEVALRPWFWVTGVGILLAGWYTYDLWQGLAPASEWVGGVTASDLRGALSGFADAFMADRFSLVFTGIILAAALVATLLSSRRREDDLAGYLALILFAATGMAALVGAGSLITMFLGIELLSLSLYVVVGFRRGDLAAKEGALKYLILGSAASGFLLFGFALIYGVTGSVMLTEIQQYWTAVGADGMSLLYRAGLALTLVGFAFKLALVPFHTWAPDAYQSAPAPVTAFMAVGTKAAAFAALLRLLMVGIPLESFDVVMSPLAILAALSMFVGSILAVQQQNMKRLLAYSSIAHAGYLALAVPGLTGDGMSAAIFYFLAYLAMTAGAFGIVVWLGDRPESQDGFAAYRGLFYRRPIVASLLTLFLLSLTGIPATGGFVGKLVLLGHGVDHGATLLVVSLVLTTGISAYAYLRVVLLMTRRPEAAGNTQFVDIAEAAATAEVPSTLAAWEAEADREVAFSWPVATVVGLSALATLYLGIFPESVLAGLRGLLALP